MPKPEMPEHKAPWIGPHDIMVPSLEYVGEDHIRGWNVGPEIFGDGLPHDEDKEDKSYIVDKDVDQRITYMGDPMNVNGEQLPGTGRASMHACTHACMQTWNTRPRRCDGALGPHSAPG